MSRLELLLEAERRGILPPDKRALLQEARRRGLIAGLEEEEPVAPALIAEPERTIGGYAKEALKGIVPGAAGMVETAITGAAALLPEEVEQAVRERVSGVVEPIRETFAAAPGYEDTAVRKLSEAVGSTAPFLGLGVLGAIGRGAAIGLGVSAGAGEARQRAEEEGATEGERAAATALGIGPGALEALPPIRILRRLGFGDEALQEAAGFFPAMRRAAVAGGEEALQETSSQVLQNLIAKGVYNPEQAALGGVGEAAALGGGAGAIVSALADLALGRRLRGRGAEEPPAEPAQPQELPPSEEAAVVAPEALQEVAPAVELTPEERRDELERRARELRFIAQSDDRLRQAIERQEAEEASKDDLEYLAQYDAALRARDEARRRPLSEADQMGLPLVGGAAQMDLLAPTEPGQEIPGMYRPAEEALAGLKPRLRAYKEEAKDLGLKLDRKGNLKPNQFVPEITSQVSPDQERFEFEDQKELPLTLPAPLEGQGDLFAEGVPLPPRGQLAAAPAEEPVTQEIPREQFALDLPGIPMERLAPRDRVLRAMSITEDKKNIPNLRFATQLRPMELQKTLGDLKNEGAIAFNKSANEWELTPAGVENVRTGSPEVKPPRRRRGPSVSVPPQGAERPDITGIGERGLASVGAPPALPDVREGPSAPALIRKPSDELFDEVQKLKQQALSMLVGKYGKRPIEGSPRRKQYDALQTRIAELTGQWGRQIAKENATAAPETAAAPELVAAPAEPATPPVDRMALIRRAQEQRIARTAVDEVTGRRTALRTQAIDAFDADEINEKTYTAITDELKKPVPNFARVTAMLEGRAKPKREKDVGLKFQRAPAVDEVEEEIAARKVKRQEAIEIAKANAYSAFADQNSFKDLNESIGAYEDNVRDTLQEYGLNEHTDAAIAAYDVEIKKLTGKETLRTQRGKVPATPKVAPERAQVVAAATAREWTNPPVIVVARSIDDPAIAQFRDQIPEDAKGFYTDGTTYVIADRATDEASVRGTVLHESLGHYGLEQEFQGGLRDEMQGIYNTNKGVQRLANARMAKDKSLDAATAVEEILAERSEAGPIKEPFLRSALNRLVAYVRNYLRRKGFVSKYSDNDITQMLRRAHERVTKLKKAPYDPFNPRVRYQRNPEAQRKGDIKFINAIGQIPERLPAATKETFEDARNAASKLPPATRRALFEFYNAHDMDRIYGFAPGGNKITKGYAKLWSALNEEGAYLFKLKSKITENVETWQKVMNKYSPAERDRIYNLFMDTTVEQVEVLDLVDPSRNITWTADKESPIYKEFQKLSPEVKEVYKGLRLAYMDYSLAVENALKQYLTPTEWQKLQNKFNERRLKVYLPLYRTGDYKLRYVDRNGDTVALQFETPRERAAARQEALRQGVLAGDIIESKVGTEQEAQVPPSAFFADVVGRLTKAKVDPTVVNSVVEAYLDLLPARSVLQLSRKRQRDAKGRGIKGFSNNVLEAYANIGSSYANRVANITYGNKFNEAQIQIKGDLSNAVDTGMLEPNVVEDLNLALENQMRFIREPNLGGYGAKASYASFHLFLGANISTAIVNVFDVVTISLNRLGGRYKYGPTINALMKAITYSPARPVRSAVERLERAEMEKLIQIGTDSGALRVQQLSDLAEFKDMDSKYARIKAGVERVSNWAFAKSDMFNRQTTFMAAYNLSKAKRGKVSVGQIDTEAIADAERAVYDVYGSSFPKAAIPIMRNDFARVALTFKTFGIRRLQLLGNAFREAAKGESKEVRNAARDEIIGYFGTAFLFAGVQGMPVVGAGLALASILNGIFGDDDEPYNPEFKLREAIGLFNYKGPVNYLLGIDIASRTGWTGMFWREDPKRMAEVGPATYVLEQLMGPAYAYGAGLIKDGGALDNIFLEGKFQQGFEQLLPRALANPMKAYRYAEEGARTANGVPLVDDVNAYNQFMQIFGFRPSDVAEAGEEAGAAKRMESKIRQRRNAIIDRAAVAQISGDSEAFYRAIQEAAEFSSKNPAVAINLQVLYGAIKRRQKKIAESVNGVTVDPKLATDIYSELGINPYE